MEVKFGKLRSNNMFIKSSDNSSDENFFLSNLNVEIDNKQKQTFAPRINDYDSNILENNAYQLISDEMFKLEQKIGILESTLLKLKNEIESLQSLRPAVQISELIERKQKIEEELKKINKEYSESGLSAKLADKITTALSFKSLKKQHAILEAKKFISKNILAKISKKIDYLQTIKTSLENLNNINSNINELINMRIPYGETSSRYEKLTAYLNKTNTIHSKITRNLNAITEKKS